MKQKSVLTALCSLFVLLLCNSAFSLTYSWDTQTTEATVSLNSIHAINHRRAFGVGDSGAVAGTSNYGQEWSFGSHTSNDLHDTCFHATNEGFMVGSNSHFSIVSYEAATGTFSYSSIVSPVFPQASTVLRGCSPLAVNSVWVCGDYNTTNIVYYYDGTSWAQRVNGIAAVTHDLQKIGFADGNNGFVAGEDTSAGNKAVYRTVDGGTNWSAQTLTGAGTGSFNALQVRGASDVWVAGDGGKVYHFNGTSWADGSISDTTDLYGVHFISATEGWVVGDGGKVYHTSNGGTSWTLEQLSSSYTLEAVSFGTVYNGWIAGKGASSIIYKYVVSPEVASITPSTIDSSSEAVTALLTIEGNYFQGTANSTDDAPSVVFATTDIQTDQVKYIGLNTIEVTATVTGGAAGVYDLILANPDSGITSKESALTVVPSRLNIQNLKIDGVDVTGGSVIITEKVWGGGKGPTLWFELTVPGAAAASAFALADLTVSAEVTIGTTTDQLPAASFDIVGNLATLESTQFSAALAAGTYNNCNLTVYADGNQTSTTFNLTVQAPAAEGGYLITNPVVQPGQDLVIQGNFDEDITAIDTVIISAGSGHVYKHRVDLSSAHTSAFAAAYGQPELKSITIPTSRHLCRGMWTVVGYDRATGRKIFVQRFAVGRTSLTP